MTHYASLITHNEPKRRLPEWLKRPLPAGDNYNNTAAVLDRLGIETICTNANCPNKGECWSKGTATVFILGNICTRNCPFCSVKKGTPLPPDKTEPQKIAELTKQLKIKYLVITSVTRDDLPDGGASQFRDVINTVRNVISTEVSPVKSGRTKRRNPSLSDFSTSSRQVGTPLEMTMNDIKFELLVPDFCRNAIRHPAEASGVSHPIADPSGKNCQQKALEILSTALPFVFGHNLETVPRLYKIARSEADYQASLKLLEMAKKMLPDTQTKSAIMLGLGETDDEIEQVLKDLRNVHCDRIAIGQYLKPSKDSLDVVEYVHPDKFDYWAARAKQLGFSWVMSSPFTRSSYYAEA